MDTNPPAKYKIIDTPSALSDLAKSLQRRKMIGVDMEADSLYHFKEKVCLIQIATEDSNIVIDPLKIKDLSALKPVFSNSAIQKVFHGADYDIRSLYRDYKINVNNLFDTQLACRFLGVVETNLEAVLKTWFDVNLNKKYQRKDWSQRPLPKDMIAYAAEDARYLIALAKDLSAKLKQKGRLAWVMEECEHLSGVRPVSNDSQPLFLGFKGAGKLDQRNLAILEALLQFRKKTAQKKDRPLFKVIQNKALLTIAAEGPRSIKKLEQTQALSANQMKMYGQGILKAVQKASQIPSEKLPTYPRKKAPAVKPDVGKRVKALREWRDRRASRLQVDPSLLFTNALISTIAVKSPVNTKSLSKIKELKQWQIEKFGPEIIAILKQTSAKPRAGA
jgi:ribonuclease D